MKKLKGRCEGITQRQSRDLKKMELEKKKIYIYIFTGEET